MSQMSIYKCNRCGCADIDQPNSGLDIIHHVFQEGDVWKHRTEKVGAAVSVGGHSSGAGVANVKSSDHVL